MPKEPKSVEIRGYQVGFGDCFLVSFVYAENDKRHLLIDFGTTELPKRGTPKKSVKAADHMPLIAADIAKTCKGKLIAVIATHRHADHISGFGTERKTGESGKIIRNLKPKVVLQPWTEDPKARPDARTATRPSSGSRQSFVASLTAMHAIAQTVVDLTDKRPAWMGVSLHKELRFLGMDNIANESAIRNLIEMGQAAGAKAVWARHGQKSCLERFLPGVKIHVLGPPDLTQTEKIKTMRSRHRDEFWHLLAGFDQTSSSRLRGPVHRTGKRAKDRSTVPVEGRWFQQRLDNMRGEQLLEIVRSLDDQMNNTSLILLFEVFGKKLLFPGDAQLENWSYALQDAPNFKTVRKLLADVDVYKVGHHGSLNATPKTLLWGNFSKRSSNGIKKLTTLLSTMPGKHGKPAKNTEVPRGPLLEALKKESELSNTNDLKFDDNPELCYTVVIRK